MAKGKWHGLKKDPKTGFWKTDFYIGGERVQLVTGTADRQQAAAFRDNERNKRWERQKLGKGLNSASWKEAVTAYAKEVEPRLRTFEEVSLKLEWFTEHVDENMLMSQVDDDLVATLMQKLKSRGRAIRHRDYRLPYSGATLNRYWAALSAFLRWCSDPPRRWVTTVPKWKKQAELRGEDRDIVWLRREEWHRLRDVMAPHRRQLATMAINTGLRMDPLTHLTWSQLELDPPPGIRPRAWIPPIHSKSKKPFGVTLNPVAVEIIKEQMAAPDRHELWVFPFRGKACRKLSTGTFEKEKQLAGIDPRFTWHGFRHTWATWHVMKGTPLPELMQMGGWHSLDMVLVYAHIAGLHTQQFADAPAEYAAGGGDFGEVLVKKAVNLR